MQNAVQLARINEELKREIKERKRVEDQLEQRTLLLSTLLDVSNLISSTMGIKNLLEVMLDKLKVIIDYQGAKVFIIKDETISVVAHRSKLSPEELGDYHFQYMDIAMGQDLVIGKQPVIINDIHDNTPTAQDFRNALNRFMDTAMQNVRSWMGLPMIIKDRVIGVFTLEHPEPGYFQTDHMELGMAFANQAAIEYENARLYSESQKKADETKTMFAVQQAMMSRLDLDVVLKMISDEARRLTNAQTTSVLLVEGEDLAISILSGGDPFQLRGKKLSIHNSVAGKHLMSGKSGIFMNTPDNPEASQYLMNRLGPRTYLMVPMYIGSRPIGIISATSKENGEFNAEDERIMNMFASSAAISIENARLYQEEKQRHQEDEKRRFVAEGLRDMLTILNANRSKDELHPCILEQATRLMGTETGAVFRFEPEKRVFRVALAKGLPEDYVNQIEIPMGMGVLGQSIQKRKPVSVLEVMEQSPKAFVEDTSRQKLLHWLSDHYHSLLAIPLTSGKEDIYGGIVLYFKEQRKFPGEDMELAMAFADQAALAIDNAVLRAQAQENAVAAERSRLARDLHDAVTQTLFSSSLIAEVLPKIWQKSPEEGKKRLEEIRQLTRGALAEMRTLLLELRPATLVEAKLDELFRQLSEAIIGRARLPVSLKIEGEPVLPVEVKIGLYRIAQEALNNVAKHSGASRAGVMLHCTNNESGSTESVELVVSDNGIGFDPGLVTSEHLGVGIMRERAEAMGAQLLVDSQIGRGTAIKLIWNRSKEVGGNGSGR